MIGARWAEIDLAQKLWVIPPERMKGKREHRVPISSAAIKLLGKMPREADSPFIFVGSQKGQALSNMAMLQFLQARVPSITVHGFRSTFRDWASETTSYPGEVVEMALAHSIKDKTEAAYRRGDLLIKRRLLMEDWAEYCSKGAIVPATIVPLIERRGAS